MSINTSTPIYSPDGKSAGCYVWRNSDNVVWIMVKINKAEKTYKHMDINDTIQQLAIEIFIQMKNGE